MTRLKPWYRETGHGLEVRRRDYTDVHGARRSAVYRDDGPAGARWILDGLYLVTLSPYWRLVDGEKMAWNPWWDAKNIADSWVPA